LSTRARRERFSIVEATTDAFSEPILLATPPERTSTQRRKTHATIPFSSLGIKCKKDIYSHASVLAKNNECLAALDPSCEVGAIFGISIDPSEQHGIGICVRNRIKADHKPSKVVWVVSPEKAVPPRNLNAPKVNTI